MHDASAKPFVPRLALCVGESVSKVRLARTWLDEAFDIRQGKSIPCFHRQICRRNQMCNYRDFILLVVVRYQMHGRTLRGSHCVRGKVHAPEIVSNRSLQRNRIQTDLSNVLWACRSLEYRWIHVRHQRGRVDCSRPSVHAGRVSTHSPLRHCHHNCWCAVSVAR